MRTLGESLIGLGVCGTMLLAVPRPAQAYHHAHSRVAYLEYSDEAFRLAERTGKPLFIVLSARWCYWCRTYERETLNTDGVAAFLNQRFVSVFVDLDERQDLQMRYVKRGIPTSVVLRPDGRHYLTFSGILPPDEFLAGMHQVLSGLAEKERSRQERPEHSARDVLRLLRPDSAKPVTSPLGERLATEFRELAMANVDQRFAGFGVEQKYPQPALLQELLLAGGGPQQDNLRSVLRATLDRIERHLLDTVEGGFHRYAERRDWSSVRYEKLLPANAALARTFQAAGRATQAVPDAARRQAYARLADETVGVLLSMFYLPSRGGFAASVEGTNQRYFRASREQRQRMQSPNIDRTIYTAWNAEAVVALAAMEADQPRPELRSALQRTLSLLSDRLISAEHGAYGRLDANADKPQGQGQLADNAWAALALATGQDTLGEARLRPAMERALEYALRELWMPKARAFRAWNMPPGAGVREAERISDAVPLRENAVMALALVKAHRLTGNARYGEAARNLLASLAVLEPDQFDDNPADGGKRYLDDFAWLQRALRAHLTN